MSIEAGPVRVEVGAAGRGLPLTLVRPGAEVMVTSVSGNAGLRRQLGDLGFVVGGPVRVVARRDGDLIVMVRGARLALDRSAARHVLTEDVR